MTAATLPTLVLVGDGELALVAFRRNLSSDITSALIFYCLACISTNRAIVSEGDSPALELDCPEMAGGGPELDT